MQEVFVDIELVNSLLYSHIIGYWERYESIWKKGRVKYKDPTAADHVEYLYNELKNRQPYIATVST